MSLRFLIFVFFNSLLFSIFTEAVLTTKKSSIKKRPMGDEELVGIELEKLFKDPRAIKDGRLEKLLRENQKLIGRSLDLSTIIYDSCITNRRPDLVIFVLSAMPGFKPSNRPRLCFLATMFNWDNHDYKYLHDSFVKGLKLIPNEIGNKEIKDMCFRQLNQLMKEPSQQDSKKRKIAKDFISSYELEELYQDTAEWMKHSGL